MSVTSSQAQSWDTVTDDQYEPDDTYEDATPITFDETQTHSLTSQDLDYYTFTINETKFLEIYVSSSLLLITLYDSDLVLITIKHDYHAVEQLMAGTYYFKIQSQYEDDTFSSYNAALHDLKSGNEPNDDTTFATFLPMNQSIRESITYIDSLSDVDYFSINISKFGYYDLKIMTPLSLDITFHDSSNLVIAQLDSNYQNHEQLFELQTPLDPGNYFVKIQGFEQSGLYNISLFMLFDDGNEPNDDINQASTLPFNTKIPATLMNQPQPNVDIWKISPQITARYTVTLFGSSYVDITIQDSKFNYIGYTQRSSNSGNLQYSFINLLLDPNDYFITVQSYSSYSENYSLLYSYMLPEGNEPNDNSAQATELESIFEIRPTQFYPFLEQPRNFHNDSDVDWYKFPLTQTTTLDLKVYGTINTNLQYPVSISIYDENMILISSFVNRSAVYLPTGNYYIEVSQVTPVIDYYVNVHSVLPDQYESDNNAENATLLTSLDIQSHTLHFIGDQDWFYFELDEKKPISIRVDGDDADDLEMYIYSSDLNQIAYNDDYDGSTFPTIRQELEQGTYYVKVQSQIKEAIVDHYEIIFAIWNTNNSSETSVSSRLKVGYSFLNGFIPMSASFVAVVIMKKHFIKKK